MSQQPFGPGRFDSRSDPAAFDFRRFVPVRSSSVRRRRDWQPGVGRGAGARRVHRGGDARKIPRVCTEILEHGRRGPVLGDGADEDVHSFVERQLVARIGDAGRRLHTGRSRNEQVSSICACICGAGFRASRRNSRDDCGALPIRPSAPATL